MWPRFLAAGAQYRKWAALTMIVVVYTTDLPMYAIFSKLGSEPEPLVGALAMGVPERLFWAFVVIDILLVSSFLACSLLRLRKADTVSAPTV